MVIRNRFYRKREQGGALWGRRFVVLWTPEWSIEHSWIALLGHYSEVAANQNFWLRFLPSYPLGPDKERHSQSFKPCLPKQVFWIRLLNFTLHFFGGSCNKSNKDWFHWYSNVWFGSRKYLFSMNSFYSFAQTSPWPMKIPLCQFTVSSSFLYIKNSSLWFLLKIP